MKAISMYLTRVTTSKCDNHTSNHHYKENHHAPRVSGSVEGFQLQSFITNDSARPHFLSTYPKYDIVTRWKATNTTTQKVRGPGTSQPRNHSRAVPVSHLHFELRGRPACKSEAACYLLATTSFEFLAELT